MSLEITITGGTVSIEDGIPAKTGDFDPKRKVRVELSFMVPEGKEAHAYLTFAAKMAHNQVLELLGKRPAQAAAAPVQPAQAIDLTGDKTEGSKPATAAKKPTAAAAAKPKEKTKADLAKEAGLPATDTQHKGTTPPLVDELDEGNAAAEPAAEPEDELADLLGDAAPTPITDKDLGAAANKWVAEQREKLKDKYVPTVIREFIATYAGEGKPMSAIPQAKRAEFVEKLKTLKGTK